MVYGMERSTEIVCDFLTPWSGLDSFLNSTRTALVHLDPNDQRMDIVRERLYAMITDYLLAERGKVLKDHWDTIDRQPGLGEVEEVNPTPEMMMKLNAICGFYGASRVIIHLYLHMYLLNALGGEYGAFVDDLDQAVERLYRP